MGQKSEKNICDKWPSNSWEFWLSVAGNDPLEVYSYHPNPILTFHSPLYISIATDIETSSLDN